MGAENFDQPLVLGAVLFQSLELEACGAECAGRRVAQATDRGPRFRTRIDQVFGQRADNAVAARIDLAYVPAMPGRGFYHAAAEALITAETPPDWA